MSKFKHSESATKNVTLTANQHFNDEFMDFLHLFIHLLPNFMESIYGLAFFGFIFIPLWTSNSRKIAFVVHIIFTHLFRLNFVRFYWGKVVKQLVYRASCNSVLSLTLFLLFTPKIFREASINRGEIDMRKIVCHRIVTEREKIKNGIGRSLFICFVCRSVWFLNSHCD